MIIVDYPYIPTATWSDDEIASLAREIAPRVLTALLGSMTTALVLFHPRTMPSFQFWIGR